MIQIKNSFAIYLGIHFYKVHFSLFLSENQNAWVIASDQPFLIEKTHIKSRTPVKIYLHNILLCAFHYFIDNINIPFQREVLPFALTALAPLFAKLKPTDNTTCTSYLWKMPGCFLRDSKICSGANCIWDQNPAAELCSRRHSSCKQKGYIRGEWQAGRINVLIL